MLVPLRNVYRNMMSLLSSSGDVLREVRRHSEDTSRDGLLLREGRKIVLYGPSTRDILFFSISTMELLFFGLYKLLHYYSDLTTLSYSLFFMFTYVINLFFFFCQVV